MIENARGKVLVIDEAYALNESTGGYGREALDTLVSRVHNKPGDDIAVIMCGYEPQIKQMLLDQNPGLQRRFGLDNAFRFNDFTDDELRRILVNLAKRDGLVLARGNANAAVKLLAKQRVKPNFGNAGAAETLFGHMKSRLVARDPACHEISLADGESAAGIVSSPLQASPCCQAPPPSTPTSGQFTHSSEPLTAWPQSRHAHSPRD